MPQGLLIGFDRRANKSLCEQQIADNAMCDSKIRVQPDCFIQQSFRIIEFSQHQIRFGPKTQEIRISRILF